LGFLVCHLLGICLRLFANDVKLEWKLASESPDITIWKGSFESFNDFKSYHKPSALRLPMNNCGKVLKDSVQEMT
jgi:hypothetical protein